MRSTSASAEGKSILSRTSSSWKALAPPGGLKAAFSRALSFTSANNPEGDRYARGLQEWNARSIETPDELHRSWSNDAPISPTLSDASVTLSDASTQLTPSRTATDMSLRKHRRPSIDRDRLPTGETEVQDDNGTRSVMLASFAAVECWGRCGRHDHSKYGAGYQEVLVKVARSISL